MPLSARLSLSVPPAVKITSDGRAPRTAATVSRDSSMRRRANRPAVCSDDAFPTVPSTAVIASMAVGSIGVVAAWARYTELAGLITCPGYPPPGATQSVGWTHFLAPHHLVPRRLVDSAGP